MRRSNWGVQTKRKQKTVERRKIVIHGRHYWMTFKEVVAEFGKDDIALAYEIWETAKVRRVDITPIKRKEEC